MPLLPHGSWLGPIGSMISSISSKGNSAKGLVRGRAGHAAQPKAVLATACWTATISMQRRQPPPHCDCTLAAGGAP